MKEFTIKGYLFEELNDTAQKKAIEENRDINIFPEWHESVQDDFIQYLEKHGVYDAEPRFTGFWSQGDGACFTSKNIDPHTLLKALSKDYVIPDSWITEALGGRFEITIEKFNHHYEHSNTIRAYVNYFEETIPQDEVDAMEDMITTWVRASSDVYYRDLEEYYDAETSDEAVKATLIDMEHLFAADGTKLNFKTITIEKS